MSRKVLVRIGDSFAKFTDCLVRRLSESNEEEIRVDVRLEGNALLLIPSINGATVLNHSSTCPMLDYKGDCDERKVGIGVGVCAILETSDERILLTRRPKHMRTFPGIWVPPGGCVEDGETSLIQTCLRELEEETGLQVKDPKPRMLCVLESVYTNLGDPKRHLLVIYFHLETCESHKKLEESLKLQPEEVDAAVWLDFKSISTIVKKHEIEGNVEVVEINPHCKKTMSKSVLANKLSRGTIYALSRWLAYKTNPS